MRSRGRGAGKGCRGSPRGRHRTRLSQKLGRHCLHRAVLGVGAGEQPATPRAVGTGHAETGATEVSGGGGWRPGAEMGRGLGRARTKARGLAVGVSSPCGHGAPRACERVRVSVRGLRPCAGPYGCGRQPQGTWRGWAFPACKGPRRGPRGHGCDSREQVPGVEAASPTGACRGLGAPALGSEATAGWSPRGRPPRRGPEGQGVPPHGRDVAPHMHGVLRGPAAGVPDGHGLPLGGNSGCGAGHLGRAHGPRPPCEPRMALGIRAAASPGRLRARPRCLQVTSLSL